MKYTTQLLFTLIFLVSACTKVEDEKDETHIWQHQTDTIEDARAVQQKLNDETERTQKQIDELEK